MTQDDGAHPEMLVGRHPYVCPRCERQTGIVDLGRAVSFCAVCGTEWRAPRLVVTRPPEDGPDWEVWAESVVKDVLAEHEAGA